MPIIVFVWEKDGTIVRINSYACKVLGYTQDEAIGKRWVDILAAEENREYMKSLLDNIKQSKMKRIMKYRSCVKMAVLLMHYGTIVFYITGMVVFKVLYLLELILLIENSWKSNYIIWLITIINRITKPNVVRRGN